MVTLWTFLIGMVGVSAILFLLTTIFKHIDRRVEQWPALWSISLLLCALIPALGLALPSLPGAISGPAVEALSLHAPFETLGILPSGEGAASGLNLWSLKTLMTGLMAVYLSGIVVHLARLGWGRHRIRQIIQQADCAEIAWQDDVLVSSDIRSPFAYTPFGVPQHSRIVLPESYRGVVSEAQILDILRHERAHLARRDDEYGLVLRVVLCLCWASPFAHRLFAGWSQSTELRCDMAVTADCDPDMRQAYADTLVQALHIMAGRVRQYPAAAFSPSHIRNEQMRIEYIMRGTRPSFKRRRDGVWLGLVASLLSATGMMTIASTASADPADKSGDWNWVSTDIVSGNLSARFGQSPDPFNDGKMRNHYGIDIVAPTGTPIYAPSGGKVLAATDVYDGKPAYGSVVVFESDDGTVTLFAHLDGYDVKAGQKIWKGDQLATVGNSGKSTGPHVHIETFRNGQRVDPQEVWNIRTK